MRTPQKAFSILVLSFSLLLPILGGCDGPAENAGESVDEATEKVGDSLEEAGDAVQDATN